MSLVPIIDIEPYRSGGDDGKAAVARQIDAACRDIGFLMISGHGVPAALIAEMYASAEAYFALPFWEKMRLKMPPDRYRGYTPFGAEALAYSQDEATPPDIKESFSIGPFGHPADAYHFGEAGYRYFAPNAWPAEPRGMRETWEAYYLEMNRHAQRHPLSASGRCAGGQATAQRRAYRLWQPDHRAYQHTHRRP